MGVDSHNLHFIKESWERARERGEEGERREGGVERERGGEIVYKFWL